MGLPQKKELPIILVSPGIWGEDIGGGEGVERVTPQATKAYPLRIARGIS